MEKWAITKHAATEPLQTAYDAIVENAGKSDDALLTTVQLQRAIDFLEQCKLNIRKQANAVFEEISSDKKTVDVGGLAEVSRYSPKTVWQYPEKVEELQYKLKAMQKKAQEDGSAIATYPPFDPEINVLFRIKLLNQA